MLPNGMKISHNSFPYKSFSHWVSGAGVVFGPSFDGNSGDPIQWR